MKIFILFLSFWSSLQAAEDFSYETINTLTKIQQKYRQGMRLRNPEKIVLRQVIDAYIDPKSEYQRPQNSKGYRDFYAAYIKKLENKENIDSRGRRNIFMEELEKGSPFGSPVKVGTNSYFFLEDSILPSPTKTSRRTENFERVLLNRDNFIQLSPNSKSIMSNELHHSAQENDDEVIMDIPRSIHQDCTKILHNSNDVRSKIIRPAFNRDKPIARRLFLMKELIKFVEWHIRKQEKATIIRSRSRVLFD